MAEQYLTEKQFREFLRALENGKYQVNHAPRHRTGGGDVLPGAGGSLTVEETDGSPTVSDVTTIKFSNGAVTDDGGGVVSVSTSGTGAPTTATYVTLSANASLTAERVLMAGAGIGIADGGANSTVTVSQSAYMKHFQISFGTTVGTGYSI
jgi:type II secretory pathway pseudopilin PulG